MSVLDAIGKTVETEQMISSNDIIRGFRAVVAMAKDDPEWQTIGDYSAAGVFRSGWVFILAIVPILLITESSRQILLTADKSPSPLLAMPVWGYALTELIGILLTWGVLLAGYIGLSTKLNIGARLSAVIIGVNYTTFLSLLVLSVLVGVGMIILGNYPVIFSVGWLAMAFWLDWGVLRRAMGVQPLVALTVILASQVVGILVKLAVGGVALSFVPVSTS